MNVYRAVNDGIAINKQEKSKGRTAQRNFRQALTGSRQAKRFAWRKNRVSFQTSRQRRADFSIRFKIPFIAGADSQVCKRTIRWVKPGSPSAVFSDLVETRSQRWRHRPWQPTFSTFSPFPPLRPLVPFFFCVCASATLFSRDRGGSTQGYLLVSISPAHCGFLPSFARIK